MDTPGAGEVNVLLKYGGMAIGAVGAWLGIAKFTAHRREKMDERFAGKADVAEIKRVDEEITRQRGNVATLFEKFSQHETADRDRHDELMRTISNMHVSLLEKLGEK
jgi:hypothetical protein